MYMPTNRKGFTLVEMIITVAVLAILIGVSLPGLYEFIKMRDKQQEETAQESLRRAMEGYVTSQGEMPSDTHADVDIDGTLYPFWAVELSGYTKLSLPEIANDVWGHPRKYINTSIDQRMDTATITIHYATLLSEGANAKAESTPGVATKDDHFDVYSNTDWWRNAGSDTQKTALFSNIKIATGSDDMLTKFTDYAQKMSGYQDTNKRMERAIEALESYARANYTAWKDYCDSHTTDPNCMNGMPERIIYYPLSKSANGPADLAKYYTDTNTVQAAADATPVVDNTKSNEGRVADMKNLMRVLGMPDDHCCSSIETVRDSSGNIIPKPFYYNSNPRPTDTSGNCLDRRGETDLKLPPRITTTDKCS